MQLQFIYSLIWVVNSFAADRVRHILIHHDDIIHIKTALGIATIVQVPARPNSVVIGDQDSFKLEYLDQAISVKPLRYGAKTNIYIYTEWQRYNLELNTGSEAQADYVVYLDTPAIKKKNLDSSLQWQNYFKSCTDNEIKMTIQKFAKNNNYIFFQIELSSNTENKIDPAWFWITQDVNPKPIDQLFLSSSTLNVKNNISGIIRIKRQDLDETKTLKIEMRRKKPVRVAVPRVLIWKK